MSLYGSNFDKKKEAYRRCGKIKKKSPPPLTLKGLRVLEGKALKFHSSRDRLVLSIIALIISL